MSRLLIKNGRLYCPAARLDETGDLLIEKGRIAALGGEIQAGDAEELDVSGLLVTPGLIDAHVHLREPGQEYKETVATGSAAAAAGGFTQVLCMPNTDPVNDNRAVTDFILEKARQAGLCRVRPVGAITKGLKGEVMTEMADLKEAGCVAVTDDGRPVEDSRVLRRAMEYAATFDLPVVCHSEDLRLSKGGVMHEGPVSARLGLSGIPAEAEVMAVERDISLAGLAGARVHIAHLSCRGSLEAVRRAKAKGVKVTCETAPHYLFLTEDDLAGYGTHFKMNPPLRTADDVAAMREGLADGSIDMVSTDHAPHSELEKKVEFDLAAFGVIGLETSLGLILKLVREGVLELARAVEAMTAAPSAAFGLGGGSLIKGGPADICVIDLDQKWLVEPGKFKSRSRNCPFAQSELTGRAVYTILDGRPTHSPGENG